MPSIDLSKVQESTGNGSFNLEPGGYVMVVTDFSAPSGRTYCQLMLDVAEGPHKGFYARSQRPISLFINWGSDGQLSFAKRHLHMFADANPGFDPNAAFQRDDWGQFVGKAIGCLVRTEMHTYNGKDYENSEVANTIPLDAVRSGDFVVPAPRDRRESSGSATPAAPTPPAPSAAAPAAVERMPWD